MLALYTVQSLSLIFTFFGGSIICFYSASFIYRIWCRSAPSFQLLTRNPLPGNTVVSQNKDEIVYTEALQGDTHPNFLAASVPIYVHRVETVCDF